MNDDKPELISRPNLSNIRGAGVSNSTIDMMLRMALLSGD